MQSRSSELKFSRRSVKMAEEEKSFSRISTKEASMAKDNSSSSSRVYYGGASAGVPFRWESQPGTPKHKFFDNSIPSLTPPPSYYITGKSHKSTQKNSNPSFVRSLFPKISTNPKKIYMISKSSFHSLSSSSSRVSSRSSPTALMNPKSLNSTSCFGVSCDASSRGRCRMANVKNALRSILGHVSVQRAA